MDKNLKIVVLKGEETRLGSRIDRSKALNTISAIGAKVKHDSGGRIIVIEASEKEENELNRRLTGVKLKPIDTDVKDLIADLDPTEKLFLEALKIRTSKRYREAKKRRKVGETPEEKKLVTASDVREEY